MRKIKEIDEDHNGFVTKTELDDILKIIHPELMERDLEPIISKFCSI